MSHTTILAAGWLAIHDGAPFGDDEVILRHPVTDKEIRIPAKVLFQFSAECVRNSVIALLEEIDMEDILCNES